jgi:integrase
MRKKFKEGFKHRYVILNASQTRGDGKRATFKIEKRSYDLGTWAIIDNKRVKHATLDAINEKYLSKELDWEQARKNVEEVVESLYVADGAYSAVTYNSHNLELLQKYLDAQYPEARRNKLSDFGSAKSECSRAIEALGTLSLMSATQKQIQDQVDAFCKGDSNKQRRIVFKLRSILAWARPHDHLVLVPDREEQPMVRYLTEAEFLKVRAHLPDEVHKVLADVCFYVGCRVGEAAAFTLSDLREARNTVFINKQVVLDEHDTGKIKPRTKNKKIREAFICPEGVKSFKRWVEIKKSLSSTQRNYLGETLKAACQAVYPSQDDKHLVWHDLRHCYAIRLLDKGLTIDYVAKMIGDSAKVAEKHYVGFIVSEPGMDLVRLKVLGNKPKRTPA